MRFERSLVRGRLVQRYKRFFADVELDAGGLVTAHVANPGAMLGLKSPGQPAWLQPVDDPKRSLKYTLEMVEQDGALVGVNTHHPNRLAAEALAGGAIPELAGYASVRREVRYDGDSRVDFLLQDAEHFPALTNQEMLRLSFAGAHPHRQTGPTLAGSAPEPSPVLLNRERLRRFFAGAHPHRQTGPTLAGSAQARPPCWLEVKNVHYARVPGLAEFPDCVAARSTKHLKALARRVEAGERAVVLFVVQRMDCEAFTACADLDPAFAAGLDAAAADGVEVLVYACRMELDGIAIARRIGWRR